MPKQITVTIYVPPDAAVRAGRSACGDVQLVLSDEDLASLTGPQREALARHVAGEQYDSRRYRDRGAGERGSVASWRDPLHMHAARVGEASVATLGALLDARAEVMAQQVEAWAREDAEHVGRVTGEVEAALAARREVSFSARFDAAGRPSQLPDQEGRGREQYVPPSSLVGEVEVALPALPLVARWDEAAEPARSRYEAARAEVEAEQRRRLDDAVAAALPAATDAAERARTEAAARQEAERAELEAVLRAHAPELVEVWRAGRADDAEVRRAVRRHVRAQLELAGAGSVPRVAFGEFDPDAVRVGTADGDLALSPGQFARLRELEAALAASGLQGRVDTAKTWSYRSATEEDDQDDVDEDGDVRVGGPVVALVSARVGGQEVKIATPL